MSDSSVGRTQVIGPGGRLVRKCIVRRPDAKVRGKKGLWGRSGASQYPGCSPKPESSPESVFKVGGKMFALCSLDAEPPVQLSVKCDPELAVQLRSAYPAIRPGYHLNKRHWNTITLDGSVPDQMVTDLLGDSYDLVVASLPKARRP